MDNASKQCRRVGCTHLRTKYSIFCDEHHQEQLRRFGLGSRDAMSESAPKHKLADFNFGTWLFTTHVINDRIKHRSLGFITLADIAVGDVDPAPYKGEGTVLHLRNGRNVRLFGMSLENYVKLLQCIDTINHPKLYGAAASR
jgi:hypothetical protein